jgi:GNAT superfamily N-acetyltransferase
MTPVIEVRSLSLTEIATLLTWAGTESWNPSPDDAAPFQAADPGGFIGCFVDGEMVAGISGVAYGETFGFIGLYICHPERRGKGYGMLVWKAAMDRLAGRTIGLDGVPAQQANYEKMGFRTDYNTARWTGRVDVSGKPLETEPVNPSDLQDILSFDRMHFPGKRTSFVEAWISPPRNAFVCRRNGRILGYAVARKCLQGYKLGPLFAESTGAALQLLHVAGSICGNEDLSLDVPDGQHAFIGALTAMGFERGFETARMYRGAAPSLHLPGIFAVTTLELG